MEKVLGGPLLQLGQYPSELTDTGCIVTVLFAEIDELKICRNTYTVDINLVYDQGITDQEKEELFRDAIEAELS